MRQVSALLAGLTPRRATWPRAPRTNTANDNSTPHHATPSESTTHDRALDHSATSPLPQTLRPLSALFEIVDDPENPDDPTPPNRPKGNRAKQTTSDPTTPAPKKTYPPVQVINYLANSTQHHTTPPEPTAPDRPLCHSTTSPLLRPPPAANLPDTEAPLCCLAAFRFADFRRSQPRARSPSQAA
jgi:hypothetical protein